MYEAHIFPRPLQQTCRFETTSLCLNTRLIVNKNFQILIIFIEISVNVCLSCAHHVMKSIILHTRRPIYQYKACYAFDFMFQLILLFRILWSRKARFPIVPFRTARYVYKSFMCLEFSKRVRN